MLECTELGSFYDGGLMFAAVWHISVQWSLHQQTQYQESNKSVFSKFSWNLKL